MVFVLGSIAAMLVGMSKTGVPGLGIVSVLLMALALPGAEKTSMGVMVPLLIAADAIAVAYHHRSCDWRQLVRLIPSVALGMVLGSLVLWALDDRLFRLTLAVLILTLVLGEQTRRLFGSRPKQGEPTMWWHRLGQWSWLFGFLAGATTMIGNAAGPVMSVYLMAQNRDKSRFMGTYVVFFALVNVTKFPVVASLGMITPETLWYDATLLPAIVLGGLLGRRLFLVVPERVFFTLVTILNLCVPIQMIVLTIFRSG